MSGARPSPRRAGRALRTLPALSDAPDIHEAARWLTAATGPCARALTLYRDSTPPPGAPRNATLERDRHSLKRLIDQTEQSWLTCLDVLRRARGTTAFEQTVRYLLRLTGEHGACAAALPDCLKRLTLELRYMRPPQARLGSHSTAAWTRSAARHPERPQIIRDPRARRFRA